MEDHRTLLDRIPGMQLLPEEVRKLVLGSFVPVTFTFGTPIVREGEVLDGLYVMASGRARILKRGNNGEDMALDVLRTGDAFGATALLEEAPHSFTVRASSEVIAYKLDKGLFKSLVQNHPALRNYVSMQIKLRGMGNFFKLYTPFANLSPEAMTLLLTELEPVQVRPGELVVRAGDEAGPMYIIEEGKLRTFIEQDGRRKYLAYLRKGEYFGEGSLLRGTKRAASVEAMSEGRLLRLTPATFQKLLEQSPDFRKRIEERVAQYEYKELARIPLDFAEEMLPAEASVADKVGLDQVTAEASSPDRAAGPFASPEGYFVRKSKRIRRFPYVRQIDEMDCGAACIAMICRHFGRQVSLAKIRQLAHTSTDGTTLKAICRAATELGLAARAVKVERHQAAQMPVPAVLHWEGNHWVVAYHIDEKQAWIADPGLGMRQVPLSELLERWTGYAALFDYTVAFEDAPEGGPSVQWLWGFLKPFVPFLLQAGALAVMVSFLEMTFPVFTQVIVDKVLVDKDVGLLHIIIASMMGLLGISIAATIVQRYLISFVAVRVDASTLDFLTRQLLSLPLSYFGARRTGDIQRRLAGMRQVREFVVQNGVRALTALAQLVGALVLMAIYSPVLFAVFLSTTPLYIGLMRFSSRVLRPLFNELEETYGKYSSYQIDSIKGVETVKAMGVESAMRGLMLEQFLGMAQKQFKADFTTMCYEGVIRAVTFISTALFLWVGAGQVMSGQMTIGGLVAFNALVGLANGPIQIFLSIWDNGQLIRVLLDRLNDVFEQEPEQGTDHSRLLPVRTLEGRITLQNVGFQYGGPQSPRILEGLTIDVPAGKRVAIVGRSGSGKTTLIKCLAGLLEPTEGTLLFDGLDLRTLNYRDLRQKIGFVLQENYIFNDTIARNIAFGEAEPDMDQVMAAARAANAHEFIERLPLGYETKIGESGMSLSGGQKQRVAIARALFHMPPVLIFDEATSALDTESERAVKENIDQILSGRTSFIIAHRLSTIRDADLILVLEKGQLVEAGSHEELMTRQGLYYYLCSQQLGM